MTLYQAAYTIYQVFRELILKDVILNWFEKSVSKGIV